MPDRIIRSNILTSDPINSLSWGGEVFYRRLMSIVDDFGRYDGRAEILRGQLYSLKLSSVSKSDVAKWLGECSKAGLVRLYLVEGKEYIEILKFGQRLRAMRSKFPEPVDNQDCCQLSADVSNVPPESDTETNTKQKEKVRDNVALFPSEILELKKQFKDSELEWIYNKLSNYKLTHGKKYKSDYGAINSWVIKSFNDENQVRPATSAKITYAKPNV